jgi:hypothetical protein
MQFSEFLIEKGLINREQLLGALLELESASPRPGQLAREQSILSEDELTAALEESLTRGVSFEVACKRLKIWNAEIERRFNIAHQRQKLSFERILVKNRVLSLIKLVEAQEEYNQLPQSPVAQYCTLFNPDERAELSAVVSSLAGFSPEDFGELQELIEQCRICFEAAGGLARAAGADVSGKLLMNAAEVLASYHACPAEDKLKRISTALSEVLNLVGKIQESVREYGNEKSFFSQDVHLERVNLVSSWLELLIRTLAKPEPKTEDGNLWNSIAQMGLAQE